jgi:hypothetical protein
MAQIIHADGSIISQDQKRNQLGYTMQEAWTHQAKMLKEAYRLLKLTNAEKSNKNRQNRVS